MLINQLLIGTVIVILMVILHVSALVALTKSLNTVGAMLDEFRPVLKLIIICGFCVLNKDIAACYPHPS